MSKRIFANEDTLAVAGTSQILDQNDGTSTFDETVDQILVTATKDCFIAKSSSEVDTAASGGKDDRSFIKANEPTVLPWSGSTVYFVNANSGETPSIYVTGVQL